MQWERLCGGEALPGSRENSSAIFLEPGAETGRLLEHIVTDKQLCRDRFSEGCLVMLVNGEQANQKHLCLLTPGFELVYRSAAPVLSATPGSIDEKAIEDGRLSLVDGLFYLWYCGYNGREGRACAAFSRDLLHWEKRVPLPGDINQTENKDHVIFPDKIGGHYYMLHRPWGEALFGGRHNMPVCLARSESLPGNWENLGVMLYPRENPAHAHDWLGGGTMPLALGGGRYLELYHNAWFDRNGYRQYHAAAAIVDFRQGNPSDPVSLVTHRLESILVPEQKYPNETNGALRIDIVFPMCCYQRGEWLYLIYGAGDKVTCAARTRLQDLLEVLQAQSTGPERSKNGKYV